MKISISFFTSVAAKLNRRATWLAFLLGITCSSWLLWQGWGLWNDKQLPNERVVAKQLRVNESQRLTVLKSISAYHKPLPSPNLPSITFQGGSSI